MHRHDVDESPRALDLVDVDLGEPDVAHLALTHELGERRELFVVRHGGIDPVQLPQIDALDLEALEASLERLAQMAAVSVRRPLIRSGPLEATLCRDHQPLRIRVQRLGDEFLGHVWPVRVGRVDEIHSELDGAPKHADRFFLVRRRPENARASDAHGAQAHAIDDEIAAERDAPRAGRGRGAGILVRRTLMVRCHGTLLMLDPGSVQEPSRRLSIRRSAP